MADGAIGYLKDDGEALYKPEIDIQLMVYSIRE
jgi:hypothetical protein